MIKAIPQLIRDIHTALFKFSLIELSAISSFVITVIHMSLLHSLARHYSCKNKNLALRDSVS